jgi:hypothetical protein
MTEGTSVLACGIGFIGSGRRLTSGISGRPSEWFAEVNVSVERRRLVPARSGLISDL